MFKIVQYKSPYTPPKKKDKAENIVKKFYDPLEFSVRRSKRVLHDYVECNEFNLFVTFTFSPAKVNRYDVASCYKLMQCWLFTQHQKDKAFQYLIVPEKHKDGAIHFHALVANAPFRLIKSNVIQNSRRVYNVANFKHGFTNATFLPVDDDDAKQKAGNYIAKYISKDMITVANRRRYWASRNLRVPNVSYNTIYDTGLYKDLTPQNMISETDYNVLYQVSKKLV